MPTHVMFCLFILYAALNSSNIKSFLLSSQHFLGTWIQGSLRNVDSVANNAMPTYYNSFCHSYTTVLSRKVCS
jgi:hypothetical protein